MGQILGLGLAPEKVEILPNSYPPILLGKFYTWENLGIIDWSLPWCIFNFGSGVWCRERSMAILCIYFRFNLVVHLGGIVLSVALLCPYLVHPRAFARHLLKNSRSFSFHFEISNSNFKFLKFRISSKSASRVSSMIWTPVRLSRRVLSTRRAIGALRLQILEEWIQTRPFSFRWTVTDQPRGPFDLSTCVSSTLNLIWHRFAFWGALWLSDVWSVTVRPPVWRDEIRSSLSVSRLFMTG